MATHRCVGIDVGARELVVAIEGRAGTLAFANDVEGQGRLLRLLRKRRGSVRVCLEASGIYHLDVALALHRAPSIEVMVVNPVAARDFGRALLARSKTDAVDAATLAAHLRGPAAAEHRPDPTLRRQAPPRHDAAPLGCVRCSTVLGSAPICRDAAEGDGKPHVGSSR